jgi:phosphopantothenate synthetase
MWKGAQGRGDSFDNLLKERIQTEPIETEQLYQKFTKIKAVP